LNEETEKGAGPFVYQASVTFLQPCEDIILVKAYTKEQAQEIIEESFKGVEDLKIYHLTIAEEQISKSVLKGIKH